MTNEWVFDTPYSTAFFKARALFLDEFLPPLTSQVELRTALDVGCGVGHFSRYLTDHGFSVTALDGRADNVVEARRRHPDVCFDTCNIEETPLRRLETFDLVLCFGLLYHLENPFAAIRNLRAVTSRILLIESMVVPGACLSARLYSEPMAETAKDQGLHYIALILSEPCMIKMLYRAGFSAVYRFVRFPDHEDFRERNSYRRKRTMLVAANTPIDNPILCLVPEPRSSDPWLKRGGYLLAQAVNSIRKLWT